MEGFAGDIGVSGETAQDGHARIEFDAGERHLNAAGTVHGGVLSTLADSAMGLAARTRIGDGEPTATSQLTIAFLTPGRPGRLIVTAEVRKRGEHLLVCDAEIEQDGRTLAHAVATFAVL